MGGLNMQKIPEKYRTDPVVSCTGKQHFESFDRANAVASRSTRRDDKKGMSAYHCAFCHGWHIGNKNIMKKAGKA